MIILAEVSREQVGRPRMIEMPPQTQQVLNLLAKGSSAKEIASVLGVGPRVAKEYLRALFQYLLILTKMPVETLSGQSKQSKLFQSTSTTIASGPITVGYGMPCSNCRIYYPANLDTCPVCMSADRVTPDSARNTTPPLAPLRSKIPIP